MVMIPQEGTLVKVEKTTDSTINQPIFIVTAKPESVVNFLVYTCRKNAHKDKVD